MKAKERNELIITLMEGYIKKATDGEYTMEDGFKSDLDGIFDSKDFGIREVVLTALMGKMIDKDFKPTDQFYKCKPRGIYETPIRNTLLKYSIPNKKSGPLNIAKAQSKLDEAWANGRSDKTAARCAVRLIAMIESKTQDDLENFAIALHRKFLDEANRIEDLAIEIADEEDPTYLYAICKELIDIVPDGGNTPQRIFGLILHNYHEFLDSDIVVTGYEDSASTTSTTSKKPGDVNEELEDGTILNVYEITVKKFDENRMRDSHDTVQIYNEEHETALDEIIVVCRRQDCHPEMMTSESNWHLGSYEYRGMTYYFVDVYEWIYSKLIEMNGTARNSFHTDLSTYINHPNTSEALKVHWSSLHNRTEED